MILMLNRCLLNKKKNAKSLIQTRSSRERHVMRKTCGLIVVGKLRILGVPDQITPSRII